MKKNQNMCSVCFQLDEDIKKDMQDVLSKTPYSMARAFQIFAKMCSHKKDDPKFINDFLYENSYDTMEDIARRIENEEKGYTKLKKHDLIEVDD